MGLHDYTFYDLINRNAVSFGNLPAWFEVDDQRSLTFAEYKQKVDQLACGLQKAGLKKGDRIGVLGKNSLEYFLLYGAAAALGGIVLPWNIFCCMAPPPPWGALCCPSTGGCRPMKPSLI
jgi:long-chain acyl-CoA synthetase